MGLGRRAVVVAALLAIGSVGCGGGTPLLHPARTMNAGDLRAMGGVSANVAVGSLADDLRIAREIAGRDPAGVSSTPEQSSAYAKGALVSAAVAPGLAPFVGARIGVGSSFEGGLVYTGRSVRADMRRSFDEKNWSFSLGLGGTAALYGRQQGQELPGVDLGQLKGYGLDLPILGGWQSNGGLYMFWFGARAGFEIDKIERLTSEPKPAFGPDPVRLDATRWYGGPLLGAATGFRHVHVALEIAATYNTVSGRFNETRVNVSGFAIVPATALWWTFD
jgi:hypothetical protein